MRRLLRRLVTRTEGFIKGMLFDCRNCGQCVLSKTGLVCPMTCPKALRNGPCGGTLDGQCEVYPDQPCIHVRIHGRVVGQESTDLPPLLPPVDPRLFHTSSYINWWTRRDAAGTTPLEYLDLGHERTRLPQQTGSKLEAAMKAGEWIVTSEIRSPRSADWSRLLAEADVLRGHFHAVNATAYLNGRPSVSSPVTAGKVVELGLEAIAQATCRDHTRTSFVSELMQNQLAGVHNLLCLTGDYFAGSPCIRQVYDMDSSLMLYEARCLRERSAIQFTGQKVAVPPKPWLGAAINPFTTPQNIPVRRLKQKAAAGADFIQSQLILDVARFGEFMARVCDEGLDRELFILAGVPVVVSAKALEMLPSIPGVWLPEAVHRRLREAADLRREGVALAVETVQALRDTPGVCGVHLMLFGTDSTAVVEVRERMSGHAARPAPAGASGNPAAEAVGSALADASGNPAAELRPQ
ncbi:MAG: methylenetetrahydrofolate reductase C-terminal domain-containing protein [Armatimonadetes bacterium]|nr:methylenetetrahydrofolate reductase C-terminal domain-containing protein [Armatimonadota bacterium]